MDEAKLQLAVNTAIASALSDHLPAAVQNAVDTAVNGKIKALTAKVDKLTNEEGTGKLDPIISSYTKWLTWRRGVAIFLGAMLALGGLLQTLQTFYEIATKFFVIQFK